MPFRWQISTVVGVGRMLAVLPAESARVMLLMVSEKLTSWSEGASVMRTGTVACVVAMLVAVLGVTELEQPESNAAARAKDAAAAKRRECVDVQTIMCFSIAGGRCQGRLSEL